MAVSIAMVCEGPADARTGGDLADRVLRAEVEWIQAETLQHYRCWRGFAQDEPFLLWRDIRALAASLRIKAHGHFDGQPGEVDAHAARRALLVLHAAQPRADAAVLLRDSDGVDTDRRRGLEQARAASTGGMPIVIGLACANRECWVLAGFEPQDDEERQRLAAVKQELGFDPRAHADELTAKHSNDKRSAKRVVRALTSGDSERETACWRETDISVLVSRGRETGLVAYLHEVRERLVPLLTNHRSPL